VVLAGFEWFWKVFKGFRRVWGGFGWFLMVLAFKV